MSLTFLAAADLHLGRASSGANLNTPVTFEWAPQAVSSASSTAAWYRIVQTATERKVNAVLLAGDLIDRDNHFFEARSALVAGFNRLAEFNIPVIAVSGNHDATVLPEVIATQHLPHVHLLGQKGKWEEKLLAFGDRQISFVGWSFPEPSASYDPLTTFDLPPSSHPRMGLLHCDFGAVNSPYAPVTLTSLQQGDVQCWVLGHIHKPWEVHSTPLSFYPGSPQSLSAKEAGPHGCELINIDDFSREKMAISSVFYDRLEVNITGCTTSVEAHTRLFDALVEIAESRPSMVNEYIFDLVWTGELANPVLASQWDPDEPGNIQGVDITIRTVSNECSIELPDLAALAREGGPAGVLASAIIDIQEGRDTPFLARLRASLSSEIRKLNTQISFTPIRNDGALQPDNQHEMDTLLLQECRALLSSLLLTREESQ